MNRNKEILRSDDQILHAARTVYQITKLLKLTQAQWTEMFTVDVFSKVEYPHTQDGKVRLAYAQGVHDVYLTILLTEHCEFVYFNNGVRLTVKEAIQQGPDARAGAVCGRQWLDSEFNFTEFVAAEVDAWI